MAYDIGIRKGRQEVLGIERGLVLAILDEALKQAICALLAQHPDIEEGELRSELAANIIIHRAWDLRDMIRGYRAALMRERRRRDIPF